METGKAVFAAGCFWGVEHLFKQLDGVVSTTVGYTGGHVDKPTYDQVKTGTTGHYEAVLVEFDPQKITYEDLVKYFFEIHDFTQEDGQGPDIGPQYRSNIFYLNENQKKIAQQVIMKLLSLGYDVKTGLLPYDRFWPAEDYHQDYYDRTGKGPYCHIHRPINWDGGPDMPRFFPDDFGPTMI